MSYHLSTTVDGSFDETIEKVTGALKEKGFGVLTTIDFKKAFKEKINKDFRPYTVLGACNPGFAYKALGEEDKLGVLLPCNILVEEIEPGKIGVSAMNPAEALSAVGNPALEPMANEVQGMIEDVIKSL